MNTRPLNSAALNGSTIRVINTILRGGTFTDSIIAAEVFSSTREVGGIYTGSFTDSGFFTRIQLIDGLSTSAIVDGQFYTSTVLLGGVASYSFVTANIFARPEDPFYDTWALSIRSATARHTLEIRSATQINLLSIRSVSPILSIVTPISDI